MPDYTSVRATVDAANKLRTLTAALTGHTRRRVSQSEALAACCEIALRHLAETAAVIEGEDTTEGRTGKE